MLRDCCAILGASGVLAMLVEQLRQAAAAGAGGAEVDWRGIEAVYHCLGSLKDEGLPHGLAPLLEVRALPLLPPLSQRRDLIRNKRL